MRIIAGIYKGKKLKDFKGEEIRPTSDRAKEALFSILSTKILNCNFLDLCSGSGAMGIESYSRGASAVTFVDKSPKSLALTKENALSVNLTGEFVLSDAENFILKTKSKFDVIFYDPPYAYTNVESVLQAIKRAKILNDEGVFIYERQVSTEPKAVDGFELYSSRKYGIAVFDFYKETL